MRKGWIQKSATGLGISKITKFPFTITWQEHQRYSNWSVFLSFPSQPRFETQINPCERNWSLVNLWCMHTTHTPTAAVANVRHHFNYYRFNGLQKEPEIQTIVRGTHLLTYQVNAFICWVFSPREPIPRGGLGQTNDLAVLNRAHEEHWTGSDLAPAGPRFVPPVFKARGEYHAGDVISTWAAGLPAFIKALFRKPQSGYCVVRLHLTHVMLHTWGRWGEKIIQMKTSIPRGAQCFFN